MSQLICSKICFSFADDLFSICSGSVLASFSGSFVQFCISSVFGSKMSSFTFSSSSFSSLGSSLGFAFQGSWIQGSGLIQGSSFLFQVSKFQLVFSFCQSSLSSTASI
ncbi:Hypothetical_protein [Hexamita inflata]|uniref:Hypothetical_protein n=1 Tax=Hexamita inflata TaxID=28002 RepID=A0AA86UA29_9EUKA|nr:Hypothetical protein HINF_LOCUS30947 [Hexamita inflata]